MIGVIELNHITLIGTYYEIGKCYGQLLRNEINLPKPDSEMVDFADRCEEYVTRFAPDIIRELSGVADGANCDFDVLKTYFMHSPSLIGKHSRLAPCQSGPHCTVFAISKPHTISDKVLFARNYDFMSEFENYLTVFSTYPTNKLASVGFSDHVVGRYGGVNQEGLAIAGTNVYLYNGKYSPGLLFNIIIRWALDNCKTVKEVVDFLLRIPLSEGINFLIADRAGSIFRAETTPEKTSIISNEDGISIATNHFQSNEMQKLQQKVVNVKDHTTFPRVDGLRSWFKDRGRRISIEMAKEILRDHQHFLCDHSSDISTIWSWITSLGTNTVFLCSGSPCKNAYRKISF